VIESKDFSPIAKYQNVDLAAQDIVMLQDDKMKVDSNTATTMVNVVNQRNEDPLFSGLYPRYIKNMKGSASVEAATGGKFSDGIVYKTQGGGNDSLPFQLLKGRVFVVNNVLRAVQNYTLWMKAEGEFEGDFSSSKCGDIPTFAGLSTAHDLVNEYPFCDDISFQYFTQVVRERHHRVTQAWVEECPELEKFEAARGGGGHPEDKTICLQALNCLMGFGPTEYPLFTRDGDRGFGQEDHEHVDPNSVGVC
jgi:hypothetical protein